ncbi:MAG: efflux RND transporter periplasmic adaptor subunit [Pseudomonadota bacterium]
MQKILRWLLLIALAGGVAAFAYTRQAGKNGDELSYSTVKVERGPLTARVTATGTLSALITVQVGSQVSGRIQSLHADFNSKVKKGEVIARLDPQLFDAAVQSAQANLAAAEGNLARAKALATDAERQAQRAQEVFAQKLISQAERDTAQANAESARASVASSEGAVAQAKAALYQAKINLAYTVITSPTSGVVISRNVDVGQTVAAALQAPTLFTIAEDLRKMQVHTSVAESDVGKLTEGMEASFTVDAYPSERFRGAVSQVRNAPQILQNVVTYDAVIDVDNADLRLKPGMTANVNFVYAKRDDALLAPNAALRFRPPADLMKTGGTPAPKRGDGPANARTLWVLRETQPVPVQVEVGVSDGSQTEITGGELQAGDSLITEAVGAKPKTPQTPMRMGF